MIQKNLGKLSYQKDLFAILLGFAYTTMTSLAIIPTSTPYTIKKYNCKL
jgi:hypothetical protein